MAMEHGPFEDIFPTQNGHIPASYVSLPECISGLPIKTGMFHFQSRVFSGNPQGHGTPFMVSFPYELTISLGILDWEWD